MTDTTKGVTRRLAEFIVNTETADIPDVIFDHAKVAFMDWLGVTLAGKDDSLVLKLLQYADLMGGNEQASILGHGKRTSIEQAALVNGAASHALDYDDTLAIFLGHPSVAIFPGLLSLSEFKKRSGVDFLSAYLVGFKAGAVVSACTGGEHYMAGFHATATMGALAAAATCAHLLGLDTQQTVYTLGIAGTQAAGLKRVFGTMCKPYHAGKASETGVRSALLAENGFTSAEDILEGANGLFQAMRGGPNDDALESMGKTWAIEQLAQKYHASCHATHSPIEAALLIFEKQELSVDDVKSITILSSELSLSAAYRADASTGLEGKFCIPYCVANALLRGKENTGLQAFTDEKVNEPGVKALMKKITVIQSPEIIALDAKVEIETTAGDTYSEYSDILNMIPELAEKKEKIKDKFADLCEPAVGSKKTNALLDEISHLEKIQDMNSLIRIIMS